MMWYEMRISTRTIVFCNYELDASLFNTINSLREIFLFTFRLTGMVTEHGGRGSCPGNANGPIPFGIGPFLSTYFECGIKPRNSPQTFFGNLQGFFLPTPLRSR